MRWPWISRKKHERRIAALKTLLELETTGSSEKIIRLKCLNSIAQAEIQRLRSQGFNILFDRDPSSNILTVGATQGFTPDVVLQMMKDPEWAVELVKEVTLNLVRHIEHYAKKGGM